MSEGTITAAAPQRPSRIAMAREKLRGHFGDTAVKACLAIFDQGLVSGSRFLTTVIVGRICGLAELGAFALGFSALILISVLQEAFVWTPCTVFSSEFTGRDRQRYDATVLIIQTISTIFCIPVVGVTWLLMTAVGTAQEITAVVAVLALAAPMILTREYVRRLLLVDSRVAPATAMNTVTVSVQLLLFLILIAIGRMTAVTAITAMATANLLAAGIWLFRERRRFDFSELSIRPVIVRHWVFGRWLGAQQLVSVSETYVLHWLLAVIAGTAATGLFAACMSLVRVFNPIIMGIGSVLIPRSTRALAEGGNTELRRVIRKTTLLLATALAALCGVMFFFGEAIAMALFNDPQFISNGFAITLLSISMLAAAIGFPADNGLRAVQRPEATFRASAVAVVTTLLLAPFGIMFAGVIGAALADIAGAGLGSFLRWVSFTRHTDDPEPAVKGAVA